MMSDDGLREVAAELLARLAHAGTQISNVSRGLNGAGVVEVVLAAGVTVTVWHRPTSPIEFAVRISSGGTESRDVAADGDRLASALQVAEAINTHRINEQIAKLTGKRDALSLAALYGTPDPQKVADARAALAAWEAEK